MGSLKDGDSVRKECTRERTYLRIKQREEITLPLPYLILTLSHISLSFLSLITRYPDLSVWSSRIYRVHRVTFLGSETLLCLCPTP